MRETLSFWLAPAATRDAWTARPGRWTGVVMLAELLAAAVAVTALGTMLTGLPVRTLAVLALPVVGVVLTWAVLRRSGFPWLLVPAPDEAVEPPHHLRIARSRVALAVGTTMLLAIVPAMMAGPLRLGVLTGLAIGALAWGVLTLVALWWHGRLLEAWHPRRFWLAISVEILGNVIVAVLCAILIGSSVAALYRVPTPSMWPTLIGADPGGDVILVDRLAWLGSGPQRFDVAVVRHPGYPTPLVKRLIARSGEDVEIAGGNLWVNGEVAVRPLAVQYSQLRREPIYRYAPDTEREGWLAADADPPHQPADWPAELAGRVSGWFAHETEKAGSDGESRWMPLPTGDVTTGIPLGVSGSPERLRLVRDPVDPAIAWLRSRQLCDDLALEMLVERDAGSDAVPLPSVTMRSWVGQQVVQHWFGITGRSDGRITVGGYSARDGTVERYSRVLPADAIGEQVRLRMQNIDGVWAMWIDGRRVDVGATTPAALMARISRVELTIDSATPLRIRRLLLTTPTHYIPFGNLGAGEHLTVPDGHWLMLGDHPINTTDSRNLEAMEIRWDDGRRERVTIDSPPPDLWADTPRPPDLPPLDSAPDRLRLSADTLSWNGHMRAAERDGLLALSPDPAWQEAVQSLFDQAVDMPRAMHLVAVPFVDESWLVGRVVAVLWPFTTARPVH